MHGCATPLRAEIWGISMRAWRLIAAFAALTFIFGLGCSKQRANTPSYKDAVAQAMKNDGFNDVKVDEDRDKGVITLNGMVRSEDEKAKAEADAKAAAPGLVVADQLSVEPQGVESQAKSIESNVDQAIKDNYKAALIGNRLEDQNINYDVKNGVITLTGTVENMHLRAEAEKIAASVPNVEQVVNELKVKHKGGRATTTGQ